MWMLVEGIHLLSKVKTVFRPINKLGIAYALAYGKSVFKNEIHSGQQLQKDTFFWDFPYRIDYIGDWLIFFFFSFLFLRIAIIDSWRNFCNEVQRVWHS